MVIVNGHIVSRTREYREGWLGRRRTYKCRVCGTKFQVDTLNPLPENKRVCSSCSPEEPCIRCGALTKGGGLCQTCHDEWGAMSWGDRVNFYAKKGGDGEPVGS
jgi:hypothetical protein